MNKINLFFRTMLLVFIIPVLFLQIGCDNKELDQLIGIEDFNHLINSCQLITVYRKNKSDLEKRIITQDEFNEDPYKITKGCRKIIDKILPFKGLNDSDISERQKEKFQEAFHVLAFYPLGILSNGGLLDSDDKTMPEFLYEFAEEFEDGHKIDINDVSINIELIEFFLNRLKRIKGTDKEKGNRLAYYNGVIEQIKLRPAFVEKTKLAAATFLIHEVLHKRYGSHTKCPNGPNKGEDCDKTIDSCYGSNVTFSSMFITAGLRIYNPEANEETLINRRTAIDISHFGCNFLQVILKPVPGLELDRTIPHEQFSQLCRMKAEDYVDEVITRGKINGL